MAIATEQPLTIENVVASSSVGQELNLSALSDDLHGAEYDAERFPGLVYRMGDPKAAALVFRSGNIVVTGAKGVDKVNAAIDIVFDELNDLGIEADQPEPNIQNIVSSADVGSGLNLNALAIGLGLESVEYEPEQFPGLVYRLDDPDVVILLFGSGKAVITGSQTKEAAAEGLDRVVDEIDGLGLLD